MNLSDEQIQKFYAKWKGVFDYFLPEKREFEKDYFFYLYHLPDNIDFDLLLKACDYAVLNSNFYPKLTELLKFMELIHRQEVEANYKRQEQEALEKQRREEEEVRRQFEALSPEEKQRRRQEVQDTIKKLMASFENGVLDITVDSDKDC